MEKKKIELLEKESLAFNIMHEMLRSGKWMMEFDNTGKMVSVTWSDEFRQMLGYKDKIDFINIFKFHNIKCVRILVRSFTP